MCSTVYSLKRQYRRCTPERKGYPSRDVELFVSTPFDTRAGINPRAQTAAGRARAGPREICPMHLEGFRRPLANLYTTISLIITFVPVGPTHIGYMFITHCSSDRSNHGYGSESYRRRVRCLIHTPSIMFVWPYLATTGRLLGLKLQRVSGRGGGGAGRSGRSPPPAAATARQPVRRGDVPVRSADERIVGMSIVY
ncbi:hypothetical protein EVAR_22729_1 [Eumeta japonica]|uniref:Uncharacterized protein n=1 Tax=Eumeta variegata TaxID=151549 RepID=A0A4C1UTJ4_EUMVA|nr:hypothetical protein EVAR_22729_1 [Eumeta japonica]